ncbi:hypothetical protein H5410_013546 [Solanum commersonii]|uniref:Uncharacterized protein n=1 Tax=Solanum commersonii TaxID=4109 RepID=A0A9J5ZNP6_SOLCO|nr:hypothetical protein H5410_013546 [Solanum commersonii]
MPLHHYLILISWRNKVERGQGICKERGQQYSSTEEWISQVFMINNGTQIKEPGTGISNNVAQKYLQQQQLGEAAPPVNNEEKNNQLETQKVMNKMNIEDRKDDMNILVVEYVGKDEVENQTENEEVRNKDMEETHHWWWLKAKRKKKISSW